MKNTNNRKYFALLLLAILAGCSNHNGPTETGNTESYVNKNIDAAIASVQQTQKELYQYGAVNNQRTGVSGGIYSDSQRLELNWNGDASQLLNQLASQRNYRFITSGVKLPLPVSLKVENAEYREVIELVQTQIGYRAGITIDNSRRQMLLRYNSPVSHPGDGHAHIVATGTAIKPAAARTETGMPKATTIKTECLAVCPSGKSSTSFFSAGQRVPENPGASCAPEGQLGRDGSEKALSCKNGKWRRL